MAELVEHSLVDSLANTGELKFTALETPFIWDGTANTVEVPGRPDSEIVPRQTFRSGLNRVLAWQDDILRTLPEFPGLEVYEYESERNDAGDVIVRMQVDPSPVFEFDYDPIVDTITLVDLRPDPVVFPWTHWVKLNQLDVLMMDFIRFTIRP